MIRYLAYVEWPDVPLYEELGWLRPKTTFSYPRLDYHGTTLEWRGDSDPPTPEREKK